MDLGNNSIICIGTLFLKKSHVLKEETRPKDDIVSWFFLVIGERRFTFFYKIKNPMKAAYEVPFDIQLSFLMDGMKKIIKINQTYDVWRGEEPIGKVLITGIL